MMEEQILLDIHKQLAELADASYQKFQSSLVPGCHNILGVRMPKLHRLARQLIVGIWRQYLRASLAKGASASSHEENLLTALVIATAPMATEQRIQTAETFLPRLDNWAVCDCFVSALTSVRAQPADWWPLVCSTFSSPLPYTLRFGLVMALTYFTNDFYAKQSLALISSVHYEGNAAYYVKMAQAWALCEFFIKQRDLTLTLLSNPQNGLDEWVQRKAKQKCRESLRISVQDKQLHFNF